MGRGSRDKGKNAEREVCRLLAPWWGVVEPGCKFVPTPMSGGMRSIRAEMKIAGDLTTTAQAFPYTVEVKRREGWSRENFLKGRRSPVWGWWKQVCTAAAEERRAPMLWARRNNEEWLVLLRSVDFQGEAETGPLQVFAGFDPRGYCVSVWRAALVLGADPRLQPARDVLRRSEP